MKKICVSVFVIVVGIIMISCTHNRLSYPKARKCDQKDDYFGTIVPDPYRWLENDSSAETVAWIKAENILTANYLDKIPFRNKMKQRLMSQWNFPKTYSPFCRNGRWLMFKNSGLQNQDVLYLLNGYDDNDGAKLLDVNELSDSGTVALTDVNVSKDGKTLIYSIAKGGSDWNEYMFMDIDSHRILKDHLEWIKFSEIEPYKNGVIYSCYPRPKDGEELKQKNENSMVYFHQIGTPQSKDKLLYSDPEHPELAFSISVSDNGKYFFLYTTESTSGNALAFKRVGDKNFKPIINNCDNSFTVIDVINDYFYILTNKNAPCNKVVLIDPDNVSEGAWMEVIPEKEFVLQGVYSLDDELVADYLRDARSIISFYDYEGNYLYDLDNTDIGFISGFDGNKEDTVTFYSFSSYNTPAIIYKYNLDNNKSSEFSRSKVDFDSDNYITEQVFVRSKDGTEVPMFLTYSKNMKRNGKNPTLLYGYGGFAVNLTPNFSVSRIPILENGGIFAVVNLRGGGEYGEEWHKAGTLMNKKNVFDDCVAAAEYLIKNRYTSSQYLALQGGSNGGLLVGAVVNQRPDLFAVALPSVGVMDMLRYQKFTIGKAWASDYGTSEDSFEMFQYLYSYSPIHNIRSNVSYPAILVTTADHDDRVVPAHSFKYVATMQDKYKGKNPILIRIDSQAGHGVGKPTNKQISDITDQLSFMFYNMGITPEKCEEKE